MIDKRVEQKLKKRDWGIHKIGGLAPLCQLCKESLKICHPPIIKPTPHSWLPTISSKNFPSPSITAIFEKSDPSLLYEEGRGGGFGLCRCYMLLIQFCYVTNIVYNVKKYFKKCVCSHNQRISSLLGIIILQTLKENKSRINPICCRGWGVEGAHFAGFLTAVF